MKLFATIVLLGSLQYYASTVNENSMIEGISYADGQPIAITVFDGNISQIERKLAGKLVSGPWVAPGLIDVQINGYMGVDFSGPHLTVADVKKATKALWKVGVTTYFPTLITSDIALLKRNFAVLAEAQQDLETGQSIAGFHLEGPYISPLPGFRGAHLEKYIKKPDWEEFKQIQQAANHQIKLVTLAPEIEGAIPFIENLVKSGVVVSLGHHNGTATDVQNAVNAGASMATHLGNGCANEINRHNNPIWPQLSNDALTASIIADGHHLNKEEVRTFYKAKGVDNTILVSDALDLAGLPPGEYIRGERTLLLTPNVVKLPKENVLAGAASPISTCVGVAMDFTGCTLKEGIQMASTNPARMLTLGHLGKLEEGKRADIIEFTMQNNQMVVQKTYVAGQLVFSQFGL